MPDKLPLATLPLLATLLMLSGCENVSGTVSNAVDNASSLFASDEQKILRAGIRQYEEGQYEAASNNLQSALDRGLKEEKDQVQAHKYLAFIACVSEQIARCGEQFRMALSIDPAMELAPSEAGHPVWDPVFQAEKRRLAE